MHVDEILAMVQQPRTSPVGPAARGLKLSEKAPAPGKRLKVGFLRELTEADLIVAEHTKLGSMAPELNRLRDTHHLLARLLAEGLRPVEVSAVTGYSQSRISILQNDPAFKELLTFYRNNVGRNYVNVHERLAMVALEATAALHERLLEQPGEIKTGELIEVAKMAHDRTGMGPTAKVQSMHVTLSADEMKALKEEVKEGQSGQAKRVSADRRAEISLARNEWSARDREAAGIETRGSEEGTGIRDAGGTDAEADAGSRGAGG